MDLNKQAAEVQEQLRQQCQQCHSADSNRGESTLSIGHTTFHCVALANNRTAYYVGAIKATKARQLEAIMLAQLLQPTASKDRVVSDPVELKGLPPGTYTVAGAATAHLVYETVQGDVARLERQRLAKSRERHLLRTRQAHSKYKMDLMAQMFHITRTFGAEVRITGNVASVLDFAAMRPTVVKRLKRLVNTYNTLCK